MQSSTFMIILHWLRLIYFRTGSLKTLKTGTFVAESTAAASDTVVIVAGTIITETKSIVAAETSLLHGEMKMLDSVQIFPFVDSTLGAEPESSFSFPSFFYGYQNRACFDIL